MLNGEIEAYMKIGYPRVSSNNKDLDTQKEALTKAGCKKIFSEIISLILQVNHDQTYTLLFHVVGGGSAIQCVGQSISL